MKSQITINADDFGMTEQCTRAILESFDRSLIDTTTMLVTGSYFDEAVDIAKSHGLTDKIGLHLNLIEGEPLTEAIKGIPYFCKDGKFRGALGNKLLSKSERNALAAEIESQIVKLETTGISIHHLDSHQGAHLRFGVLPIVIKECKKHGISKIRIRSTLAPKSLTQNLITHITNLYIKLNGMDYTRHMDYYGNVIDYYIASCGKTVEVMCHPDYNKDGLLIDRKTAPNPGQNLAMQYKRLQDKT